mgnify:CR=1 FL=1
MPSRFTWATPKRRGSGTGLTQATACAHRAFLDLSGDITRRYAEALRVQAGLISAAPRADRETGGTRALPVRPAFDRSQCLEFARGSAATCAAYAAAKAGVINLTRTLAVEWAPHHIRVNCISPGYIENPGMPEALEQFPALKERLSRVPLQRTGKQEDIVGGVIYLASDAASHITGTEVWIDGGQSLLQG